MMLGAVTMTFLVAVTLVAIVVVGEAAIVVLVIFFVAMILSCQRQRQ